MDRLSNKRATENKILQVLLPNFKRINKKGQETFGMSFGMIFSIILIVVFMYVAFIAIRYFLTIGRSADVGIFYQDLQTSVNELWQSQSGELTFDIHLPRKVRSVCFANLTASTINKNSAEYKDISRYTFNEANVFLIPGNESEGNEFKHIEHLNIEKITSTKNPYCVDSTHKLTIKKDFYDKLVSIQ